jgi:hypothetical protein
MTEVITEYIFREDAKTGEFWLDICVNALGPVREPRPSVSASRRYSLRARIRAFGLSSPGRRAARPVGVMQPPPRETRRAGRPEPRQTASYGATSTPTDEDGA